MAGISGNVYTLASVRQSAKGTPGTTPVYRQKVTGGGMAPARATIQLNETDASRQQGATIVVGQSVSGSPQFYLRPDDFSFWAYAALGANADSGATNFTHIATPANTFPYLTIFENIGAGALVNKYVDCCCTGLHVAGAAGGALTYTADVYGLDVVFGATDPGTPTAVSQTPLVYPQTVVTRGGAATGTVESFSYDIVNNGAPIVGDGALKAYDYVWGQLNVNGQMTVLFENDQDYRRTFTGSTSGTGITTTVATQTLSIKSTVNANLSVELILAGFTATSYVVSPDPGGAPYRATVSFASLPQTLVSDYVTLTTKNQVATA